MIYKAFDYLSGVSESDDVLMENGNREDTNHRLALRFSRVHHDYVSHTSEITENDDSTRQNLLIPFHDVAGYTGVFVAGAQPAWLMCSCKSFVRLHPMRTNQRKVIGFSQFHNVNCEHGFITIDSEVCFCVLYFRGADPRWASVECTPVSFANQRRDLRHGLGHAKGACGPNHP